MREVVGSRPAQDVFRDKRAVVAEDVQKIVAEKKEALGVTDKSQMGKLMGVLMKELRGKADGNVVRQAVEAALS